MLEGLIEGGWETKVFPEDLCVHPSAREPNVFDAVELFLVLMDHSGLAGSWHSCCTPYIFKDAEGNILYGWTDTWGNVFDHFERNIHGDRNVVVAWKPEKVKFV